MLKIICSILGKGSPKATPGFKNGCQPKNLCKRWVSDQPWSDCHFKYWSKIKKRPIVEAINK